MVLPFLPLDVWRYIYQACTLLDRCSLRATCKRFKVFPLPNGNALFHEFAQQVSLKHDVSVENLFLNAVQYSTLSMVKCLYHQMPQRPSYVNKNEHRHFKPMEKGEAVLTAAARGGHLDTVKWLIDTGYIGVKYICRHAAIHGHLHVIKWVTTTFNIRYQTRGVCATALLHKHFHILKWMFANGHPMAQQHFRLVSDDVELWQQLQQLAKKRR